MYKPKISKNSTRLSHILCICGLLLQCCSQEISLFGWGVITELESVRFGIGSFGSMHVTSVFQMVINASAHVTDIKGGKVFPNVDNFVIVADRDIADDLYNDLTNLFTHEGLPINPDKINPSCSSLTCLDITIDIINSTLSIEQHKYRHQPT